mmetsp:Transcript_33780/g.55769  ORF Transcript_33780/g.55769 Transcript_33780/m.55769 type:complete len:453 (+) Transcript_33780:142-1500(+)|eukprot:CAMPEP_0119310672 /NCGR_PEP_ID=MMETSP1333-20130426/19704_1 /TAXON_ID=418940 /ORGANISM="Scyphosphaera apsteinii, Strain RCC1455" /LENGTH=452 /DNA_ID=CAMNT_0007314893 /DNA_START=141 /DNA_END=1499 /DNA_ORIENTATION=+
MKSTAAALRDNLLQQARRFSTPVLPLNEQGQARTHRRGGLKTPRELFSRSTLWGWLASPYSAKCRALLHYKQITFADASPSALQLYCRIRPAVGRMIMPSIRLADGSWRQDSALICDEIEAEHPIPATRPSGAAQQLASSLLELHADEWLPIMALHFRWNRPDNASWAQREFGQHAFPLLPVNLGAHLVKPAANKMKSFRRAQGVLPETHPGIERYAVELVTNLEAHFRDTNQTFLLGARPCRGDFSLYGPLYAQLYRDPYSRALFAEAPHVVAWLERLHGHRCDESFPELPCRVPPDSNPANTYLSRDSVPSTLDPIFRGIFAEQWRFLHALSQSIDEHLDAQCEHSCDDAQPQRISLPRALHSLPFMIGGSAGKRRLLTYQAWRLQRPLDLYTALEVAPSRSLELQSVDAWLRRLDAIKQFCAVRPRWRLEREFKLPLAKEKFYASRLRM